MQCLENGGHSECPVCLEDMHSTIKKIYLSGCGHVLHETCVDEMAKSGRKECPLCLKTLIKSY